MIRKLVSSHDELLTTVMEPFDFDAQLGMTAESIAIDLTETCISNKGLGLAANQIGLPYRAFVLMSNPVFACFNPLIIHESDELIYLEEGCLSFPNFFIKIKRPREIRVRFTMPNGLKRTEKFSGITARCFQHELDHLNGVSYALRATVHHLDKAKREHKSLVRKNKMGTKVEVVL